MKIKMVALTFICLIEILHSEKIYSKICEQGFSNKRLNREIHLLFENPDNIKMYRGMNGCVRFSEDHFNGDMHKAIMRVSYALDKFTYNRLGWRHFYGKVETFRQIRKLLLNNDGSVKEEYKTVESYVQISEKWFEGRMLDAFISVLGALGRKKFEKLGWKQFPGTALEFVKIRETILNSDGTVKDEYRYMAGYERFTEGYEHLMRNNKHFSKDNVMKKDMYTVRSLVKSVLGSKRFEDLDWRQFHGTLQEFKEVKNRILTNTGVINNIYTNMEGCAQLAKEVFFGNMSKTFINVLSVLGRERFDQLNWRQFPGTVDQFYLLRADFQTYYPWKYRFREGQRRVAKRVFSKNTVKAYDILYNFGDLFGLDIQEFHNLRWVRN